MTAINISGQVSTQSCGTLSQHLKVRISKLDENAVIPKYATFGDAGLDLTAVSVKFDDQGNVHYGTGLAFEIPLGYVGLLFPRSSNSKKDLILSNSVGVIDAGYRGEVSLKFKPSMRVLEDGYKQYTFIPDIQNDGQDLEEDEAIRLYEVGERVGQILIIPRPAVEFIEVPHDQLTKTERGEGGYGSTGK